MERLQRNLDAVADRIARACREVGRDAATIRLVAVTKSVTPEVAGALVECGVRDLGENRVDELERKRAWLASRGLAARWHFLGHVQRNKARRVVRLADEIHSVDSPRLLETLARVAAEEGRRPALYLQVKLTDEAAKTGVAPDALGPLLDAARASELPCRGLMTLAPLVEGGEPEARAAARTTFEWLAALARELPADAFEDGQPRLSMGMSGDFEEAVRAGADVVRLGTVLFEGLHAPATGSDA